jgi:hypothetical protein
LGLKLYFFFLGYFKLLANQINTIHSYYHHLNVLFYVKKKLTRPARHRCVIEYELTTASGH